MASKAPGHGTLLIVDDEPDTATMLRDAMQKRGFEAHAVFSAAECMARLAEAPVDVVITDVNMGGTSGIELCGTLAATYPDLLTIVITGASDVETAIGAIRAGAYDFITKPAKVEALGVAVERALAHLRLKRELHTLRTTALQDVSTHGIAGESAAIRETIEMIERVANSDATVLVVGESGTGKELVARALHSLSSRRDQPFVAINCAAMPAPLLESELFGHVRGAFTDAKTSRQGLFVQAGNGTIFLDEIGEMPMEMQVKLLRVLQERRVRPVGGDEEVAVRARLVTATNRNLDNEVEDKRFREDLYYRINVVPIQVPPLRARQSDILLLAHHFLRTVAKRIKKPVTGISAPAAKKLLEYDWPGNVRELENCIERAVALSRVSEITVEDLPKSVSEQNDAVLEVSSGSPLELVTIDEMTRRYVRKVMTVAKGNKTHAARILGIDRRSLYRRLEPVAAAADPAAAAAEPEPEPEPTP